MVQLTADLIQSADTVHSKATPVPGRKCSKYGQQIRADWRILNGHYQYAQMAIMTEHNQTCQELTVINGE